MSSLFASILGGLGGMFGWGTSDFLANLSSDKVGHRRTFFWSQVAGLLLITIVCLLVKPTFALTTVQTGLLLFLGVMYAIGYLLFYKGFELGNVSVISAVINFQTVFVILISFFVRQQPLTLLQVPAVFLLFLGVTLVSLNFNELRKGTVSLVNGVKETLVAAIVFGVLYWPLSEYVIEQTHFLTVSFSVKLIALTTVFVFSLIQKQRLVLENRQPKILLLIAAVGILEAVGVLSANFGVMYGDGILVAPIASSLTIVTVGLAMIFMKERITRTQAFGIALTVIGILLTAF